MTKQKHDREHGEEQQSFQALAAEQGVSRPWEVLASMDEASRQAIARSLSVGFSDEARGDPDGEAWEIIHHSLWGLQARTQSAWRTLNPLLQRHSWREILEQAARAIGAEHEDELSEREFEALICKRFVSESVAEASEDERGEIERFLEERPELIEKLEQAGLEPEMLRFTALGLFRGARAGGVTGYAAAAKAAAALNSTLAARARDEDASRGMKIALRSMQVALWTWLAADVLDFLFGRSEAKVLPVIVQIHMHDYLRSQSLKDADAGPVRDAATDAEAGDDERARAAGKNGKHKPKKDKPKKHKRDGKKGTKARGKAS